MSHKSLFACICALVLAESYAWAHDRQKLPLEPRTPSSLDASHQSVALSRDLKERKGQSLVDSLSDQLYSIEQVTAHVQMKRYIRSAKGSVQFTGTVNADTTVKEHLEKYSHIVECDANNNGVKKHGTIRTVHPPYSSFELTEPMLISRDLIRAITAPPIPDVIDNEPVLMLEYQVLKGHHGFTAYMGPIRVYPEYTARIWYSAATGNLRRVLFLIKWSLPLRLLSNSTEATWDVRFHDIVIDNTGATVPLKSMWSVNYKDGSVRWSEQEFSDFKRLEAAPGQHEDITDPLALSR